VSGPVKFTTATAGPASITRQRVIYALGQLMSTRHGNSKLVLALVRPLRPGAYTLTTRVRTHIRRTQIMIG
jgi:hypothetical protein